MDNQKWLKSCYHKACLDGFCDTRKEFANFVGISETALIKAMNGDQKYLTENLKQKIEQVFESNGIVFHNDNNKVASTKQLPLIPIDAIAGFNGIDYAGVTIDECAKYSVPEFVAAKADYLIRVSGNSMFPTYANGDILACRRVNEITFIQWGKSYVIDSQQGAMVKRLYEVEGKSDVLTCKSDNPDYPPFHIPASEIRSLSVVVGVIRME